MVYNYTITGDTLLGVVNGGLLKSEIEDSAITIALESITTSVDLDDITITFKLSISGSEETILDGIVAAHNGYLLEDEISKVRLVDGEDTANIFTNDDRIKVDVTGTLGDGLVKVSSNDSSSGFLIDKLESPDNKITVTEQNDGGVEHINITLQSGNINTADLNNDANFIDSAGAPVQPVDIADFETSTELDARDTANRNRVNHTGTQLAITISDFNSAVVAAETTTSLSFNAGTNILSFTDEDGGVTNIDLSLYLDDTNLSRIVSGTLNAGTGICTFTRDDLTTFDVDFSSLNDQAFINAAIATHETTIDNHDDVDTTGRSAGDLLCYNGSNWIAERKTFRDFVTVDSPLMNQTTTLEQYASLSTTIPATGNYKVSWSYIWSINSTTLDFEAELELDNATTIMTHIQEAKDSAGTGITVPTTGGGNVNTSTNQRYHCSGFKVINIAAGARTIDLDFAGQDVSLESTIYQACITIEEF